MSFSALKKPLSYFFCLWGMGLSAENKAHVLFLTGLNNPSSLMQDLADAFSKKGCQSKTIALAGHGKNESLEKLKNTDAKQMASHFSVELEKAHKEALSQNSELYLVAYSMGALVHLHQSRFNPQLPKVKGAVYLAPAIELENYTYLVQWLPLPSSISLPSFNDPQSRRYDSTPLATYRALFSLQDDWMNSPAFNVPTHIILNRGDELIADSRTLSLDQKHPLVSTEAVEFTTKPGFKKHLFFTRRAVGHENFQIIFRKILQKIQCH